MNSPLTFEEMRAEIKTRRLLRHPTVLYHILFGRDNLREVVRHGLKWKLNHRRGLDRNFIKKARWWEQDLMEYFFTQAKARGCDIFLDVGSHIGFYSMIADRMRLFEEIHAWEPSPENFARLQWHWRENNFGDRVRIYQTAVSDSCGKVRMSGEDSMTKIVDSENAGVEVDCATLDSLLNFRGRKLAVKMDVEGHEISALRGAEKLFAENDIFLQIEVWKEKTETINYLISQGFRMVHYSGMDFYFERERIGGKI